MSSTVEPLVPDLDSETATAHTNAVVDIDARFATMVQRLSRLSVDKRFEAFVDVPWDEPDMAILADDPRWELWSIDPLSRTSWYLTQTPEARSRIGLHRIAQMLHTGWQFENILQVGLLIHAMSLDNDSVEFRYLHHEIAEESQHSMMFHEFVRRSGVRTTGMPKGTNLLIRPLLMAAAHLDPMVLALAALAGEEPADYLQREQLKLGFPHPVVERICRIHVTEEARHISFARHYIRRTVPDLGRARRSVLSLAMPIFMYVGAQLMVRPARSFRIANRIPSAVLREARRSPEGRRVFAASVQKVRDLAGELGLLNPLARRTWDVLFHTPAAAEHGVSGRE